MPVETVTSPERMRIVQYAGGSEANGLESNGEAIAVLRNVLAQPGSMARQLARAEAIQGVEVIGRPGEVLRTTPMEGDILLRTVEGGTAHASVIASPGITEANGTGGLPGGYVHVVERVPFAREASEGFRRRIHDPAGRLLEDLLLLRLAFPPTPTPTVVKVEPPAPAAPAAAPPPPPNQQVTVAIDPSLAAAPALPDEPVTVAVDPNLTATPQSIAEDELSCDHIDASQLSWPGASSSELDLMRRVYLRQVRASCQVRQFVGDVPRSELGTIEGGITARRDAASSCIRLLAAARAAMASDAAASSVTSIGVVSGYRSASQQMTNWNRNFPRYFRETASDRSAASGGEFGDAAAALLTRYISRRLAAPGFSLHNDGRAIDFTTTESGRSLGASTAASSISAWRSSWFFAWLSRNANGFGFYQNTSIDEPWHWEFRGVPSSASPQSDEADEATPDTVEPTDMAGEALSAETTVTAGRLELSNTPLLASHTGTQPDLILRWNGMTDPRTVDTVVHLHGYSSDRGSMRLRNKEAYSGIDFSNPDGVGAGRTSPTLGIVPRGSYEPGRNPERYTFPALITRNGIRDLVSYSIGQFQTAIGASASAGRLIITAHSGGGEPLMPVITHNNPDEIHVFDALYWDATALIRWVNTRIAAEIAAWTPGKARADSGLCVIYRRSGTGTQSIRVRNAINEAIRRAPADAQPVLQASYRVLRTEVPHNEIPRRFGWRLLADITADLSDGTSVPESAFESDESDEAAGEYAFESNADIKRSGSAYFFKGSRYVRYNIATDAVDVGPADISRFWTALPAAFQSNLDASVNWGDGHAYFFKGSRYVRYNIVTDAVDVGPAEISANWTALPAEFQSNINAAVNWGNGKAYFFKGSRYVRYDIASDTVDVGPVAISANWTALPAEFQSNIDSVVNWGNGKAYFFKGSRYLRYDIASDTVDVSPVAISTNWPALPAVFQSNVRAVINWSFPVNLAALMRTAGLTVNEVAGWQTRARPGVFRPIGIVEHHTAGTNSLNTVVNGRSDLAGPLANFHIEKSGTVNIVSGGKANHAGPGAQTVLDETNSGTAPSGTALSRGLRDGPSGNEFFYGFENENRGDNVDPWPEVQLDAMARAAAALCKVHSWDANHVIAHKEWTRRKPDPTIDMNDFRTRVGRFL